MRRGAGRRRGARPPTRAWPGGRRRRGADPKTDNAPRTPARVHEPRVWGSPGLKAPPRWGEGVRKGWGRRRNRARAGAKVLSGSKGSALFSGGNRSVQRLSAWGRNLRGRVRLTTPSETPKQPKGLETSRSGESLVPVLNSPKVEKEINQTKVTTYKKV